MILWRATRRPFADLSGEGGRLFSGRWHSEGRPVVYTAENAALAMLELRINLDLPPELLPPDYVMMRIIVPEDVSIQHSSVSPADTESAKLAGDEWLRSEASLLLRVSSAVAPESFNYLVNPHHLEVEQLSIDSVNAFDFDKRLFG